MSPEAEVNKKSRSKAANNNGQDLHLSHLQQGHC